MVHFDLTSYWFWSTFISFLAVCENLEVETHYSNSCLKKDLMEADLDFQGVFFYR